MQKKYGDLGSILYVHVPDTGKKKFDDSLKLFQMQLNKINIILAQKYQKRY